MILPNFPKNCMKLRKFSAIAGVGGGGWAPPVDPSMKGESLLIRSITSLAPGMDAHTDDDLVCEGPVLWSPGGKGKKL